MDLQTDALIDTIALPAGSEKAISLNAAGIPTSKNVTGLEIRLSRVLIKENRTPKVLFLPGRADIYLMVLVVDNLGLEPKALTISGFNGIDDNEDLPVDKTAYYWEPSTDQLAAPTQIHVLLSVIKSKKHLRDGGEALAQAKDSPEYKSVLMKLVGAVASAPTQIADLALALGGIVGGFLSNVEDKPLFTQVVSFTDINGDFDALGKTVHTKENQCVRTELTLVVRDTAREQTLAAHAVAAEGTV